MEQITLDYKIDLFKLYANIGYMNAFLFESTLKSQEYGRYSLLLFYPFNSNVDVSDRVLNIKITGRCADILDCFNSQEGLYAGFVSYNYGYNLLNIKNRYSEFLLPKVYFIYFKNYIIVDHFYNKTYIQLDDKSYLNEINNILAKHEIDDDSKIELITFNSDNTFDDYINKIKKIKNFIYEGDVYQVNLSQRFTAVGKFNPLDIYKKLALRNKAYFSALLYVNDYFIISNSPELFVYTYKNKIITKPIKGTIPRGKNIYEDRILKQKLFESKKDRSELLMIVDLERNDLSKLCNPGTIQVKKLFEVESFATVNHLVSTIEGILKQEVSFYDILKALFPGGSITGAPKIRSMEIIDQLEENPREVYTGIIGFISDSGFCTFNIAIRTLILNYQNIMFNVGGGVTWDSEPIKEYEETLQKGKVFINLLTGV